MKKKISKESFLTINENAQYFECGYSCDHALFLKIGEDKFFITDSRYTLEAKQNIFKNIEVLEAGNLFVTAASIINKSVSNVVVYDPAQVTLNDFENLKSTLNPKKNLIGIVNFHQQKRIIKTEYEIDLITKSQKINQEAYKKFAIYLNESTKQFNEQELYYHSQRFLSNEGKYNLSFQPILGINANAAKPHALPSKKDKLKSGDLLLFDAGVKYQRYCSDRTRTAYFSKKGISFKKNQSFDNEDLQNIYDVVLKAQEKTIELIRSGMKGREIDSIARNVIEKAGYGKYFVHSTGHGIGLDIHELPFISKKSETIIEDGMVFSVEPGIYIPDYYGVRIEDLVVIKNGRAEII
ncbi:M24 family metallopeptidase [Helicobacter sp. 13S00477-4]|uniref:M24 family metallopeptidase n=1 Tax=Helicobacter sp. 13S00477-4 TaxID=1905759 RepID=UPI000BA617B2|nr:M24 family metallopeptidase [Helicobacter sp. 13S00477-4]PAF52697.1 X-Pro aminopeptidase [Helicobacter sp. 13S00477-4]